MANKLLSKDGKLIGQDKTLLQAPIGGGASWGEITGNIENQTDLIDLVNSKAILHEIIYDGTNIKDSEGNILGFADIKLLLDNPHDYVYVNDLTNHCILNYGAYEDDAIWFNSRYKIDGTNYLVRLIINWNDQLQYNVDEVPNINKVLTKPTQAPTQNELVGIGTDNAQKRITIGDGLEFDGIILKATGGSGDTTKGFHTLCDITIEEEITKGSMETFFSFTQTTDGLNISDLKVNEIYFAVSVPNITITNGTIAITNDIRALPGIGVQTNKVANTHIIRMSTRYIEHKTEPHNTWAGQNVQSNSTLYESGSSFFQTDGIVGSELRVISPYAQTTTLPIGTRIIIVLVC